MPAMPEVAETRRAAILADTKLTVAELAAKYRLAKGTVQNVLRRHRRKMQNGK
jgi:Mor family transcriptional regulator